MRIPISLCCDPAFGLMLLISRCCFVQNISCCSFAHTVSLGDGFNSTEKNTNMQNRSGTLRELSMYGLCWQPISSPTIMTRPQQPTATPARVELSRVRHAATSCAGYRRLFDLIPSVTPAPPTGRPTARSTCIVLAAPRGWGRLTSSQYLKNLGCCTMHCLRLAPLQSPRLPRASPRSRLEACLPVPSDCQSRPSAACAAVHTHGTCHH
jgi:hypothetical protein